MRYLLLLAAAGLVTGCSTFTDRAEEALEAGVNPEEREVHYLREGNQIHYFRRECTGKFCDGVPGQ